LEVIMAAHKFEIVPTTNTGSERVNYALVGHGPGASSHESLRFPTQEHAMAHMEKYGLQHAARPSDDPWRGNG
jgi:hypothetical protein